MEKRAPRKTTARRKASTSEVLGKGPSDRINPRFRKYYDRLLELRTQFRRRQKNQLSAAKKQNLRYSQHMADVGTNSYEKDLALSSVSSQQDTLFEIGAALDRIEEGTYGICEATDEPIDPARLDAIPWTRFTAEAEQQLEAEGKIRQAQIPPPARIGRSATSSRVGEEWNTEPAPSEGGESTRE